MGEKPAGSGREGGREKNGPNRICGWNGRKEVELRCTAS